MITVTETARKGLLNLMEQSGPCIGFRLVVTGDTPGAYMPELMLMRAGHDSPADQIVKSDGLDIYVGPESVDKAQGVTIDLITTQAGARLKFEFPAVEWDDPVAQRLQTLIDQRINPGLMSHGGFIALLDVHDGVAEVIMGGGCQGCMLSAQTLSQSIEAIIKREIPEILTVIDCTNHAQGINPYYQKNPADSPNAEQGDKKSNRTHRRMRRNRK